MEVEVWPISEVAVDVDEKLVEEGEGGSGGRLDGTRRVAGDGELSALSLTVMFKVEGGDNEGIDEGGRAAAG